VQEIVDATYYRMQDLHPIGGAGNLNRALMYDVPVEQWLAMSVSAKWWCIQERFGVRAAWVESRQGNVPAIEPGTVNADNWWETARRSTDFMADAQRLGRSLCGQLGEGRLALAALVGTLSYGHHPEAMEILSTAGRHA
jgi:hypothetical protein